MCTCNEPDVSNTSTPDSASKHDYTNKRDNISQPDIANKPAINSEVEIANNPGSTNKRDSITSSMNTNTGIHIHNSYTILYHCGSSLYIMTRSMCCYMYSYLHFLNGMNGHLVHTCSYTSNSYCFMSTRFVTHMFIWCVLVVTNCCVCNARIADTNKHWHKCRSCKRNMHGKNANVDGEFICAGRNRIIIVDNILYCSSECATKHQGNHDSHS